MTQPDHIRERLEVALHKIITRAASYPDDTDADRKRDLYHILRIARGAICLTERAKDDTA
jgi:hypothetical protein